MSFILNSGLRIFDCIEILNSPKKSTREISNILLSKEIQADIKAVSKYLDTLTMAGFKLSRTRNNIRIIKTPFTISLNDNETKGYYIFQKLLENILNDKKLKEELKSKLENICVPSSVNTDFCCHYQPMNTGSVMLLKNINHYLDCEFHTPVLINFKHNRIRAVIQKIEYAFNGIFINCFNLVEAQDEKYEIGVIQSIEYTHLPAFQFEKAYYKTVFKLKGGLKKNYRPKEGERITYKDNEIFVTNNTENKEQLLMRLIKYGKNCEIIQPNKDKARIKELLCDLIGHFSSL